MTARTSPRPSKTEVTLSSKHLMGGDCLNTGCVPSSKALIRSPSSCSTWRARQRFRHRGPQAQFDFRRGDGRVKQVVTAIEPHDSGRALFRPWRRRGAGHAPSSHPWTVEIAPDGRSAPDHAATSSSPPARAPLPPIPRPGRRQRCSPRTRLEPARAAARLLVLGGGPIGCELSQAFARFGAPVTQVEMAPRLMGREGRRGLRPSCRERWNATACRCCGHRALQRRARGKAQRLWVEHAGAEQAMPVRRFARRGGPAAARHRLGLEELGVPLTQRGTIEVPDALRAHPQHLAWATWARPYQFTHTAAHGLVRGGQRAVRPLPRFGGLRDPWSPSPTRGRARRAVGEPRRGARTSPHEVTRFELDELDRAIADGEAHGFVKVLTAPGKTKYPRRHHRRRARGRPGSPISSLAMKHGLGSTRSSAPSTPTPPGSRPTSTWRAAGPAGACAREVLSWVRRSTIGKRADLRSPSSSRPQRSHAPARAAGGTAAAHAARRAIVADGAPGTAAASWLRPAGPAGRGPHAAGAADESQARPNRAVRCCYSRMPTPRTAGRRRPSVYKPCKLGAAWGRFDVRIDGRSRWSHRGALMNRRSRWTGIATGDRAMFVRRAVFERLGLLPRPQPLTIHRTQ